MRRRDRLAYASPSSSDDDRQQQTLISAPQCSNRGQARCQKSGRRAWPHHGKHASASARCSRFAIAKMAVPATMYIASWIITASGPTPGFRHLISHNTLRMVGECSESRCPQHHQTRRTACPRPHVAHSSFPPGNRYPCDTNASLQDKEIPDVNPRVKTGSNQDNDLSNEAIGRVWQKSLGSRGNTPVAGFI